MKKLFLITIAVLCVSIVHAQNPFEKFGYTPKIGTLSKGKYIEHFDNDSVVQIGSVLFNPFTKQITGFVEVEKVYSESTLEPEIVSRWLSPDPLADEFPDKSPYNFVNNNPIFFTDPTGLAPQGLLDDYGLDENGNITLLQKTNDNFDRLFSVNTNENGDLAINSEIESIKVSKFDDGSSILSELSYPESETIQYSDGATSERKVSTAVSDNKNDIFNVFKFAADNTNVEFSVNKFSVLEGTANYQIGTFHLDNLSPGLRNIGTALGSLHSHPGQPTAKDRRESLFGDLAYGRSYLRKNGRNLPYLIYFPDNGSTSRIGLPKDRSSNGVTLKTNLSNFRF